MDVNERVSVESDRFYAALPRLLDSPLRGRWVIFLNGSVQGDYGDEDAALDDASRRFGRDAGFVIARIEPQRVIWNTAPWLFE